MTAIQIQTVVTILKSNNIGIAPHPTGAELPSGCYTVSCRNCPLQHTETCGIFGMCNTSPEGMIRELNNILSKVPNEDLLEALI